MSLVLLPALTGTVSESNKMTGRWSNACQGVIDAARALVVSEHCTYGISELGVPEMATAVEKLLDGEVFHFGRTTSVGDFPDADYWHIIFLLINEL